MQSGTKSRKQRGFLCGSGFPHMKKSQLAASMMVLWAILTFSNEASKSNPPLLPALTHNTAKNDESFSSLISPDP